MINRRLRSFQVDLFASRASTQLEKFLQLETRPIGRGNRCLPPSLDRTGFCQPTMGLDTLRLDTDSNLEGQYCTGRPSVKNTGMVPTPIAAPVRLPSTSSGTGIQLAAWPISRDPVKQETFQRRLQGYSRLYGGQNPSPPTTHPFTGGSAGMVRWKDMTFFGPVGKIANFQA